MSDDKMFDYVLARSRTRESSILTIATIASSASMVLLGLYLQELMRCGCTLDAYYPWIHITGMTFATLGIAYSELTASYIHRNDEDWPTVYANLCIQKNITAIGRDVIRGSRVIHGQSREIENPLCYPHAHAQRLRKIILRALLVVPIIAWALLLHEPSYTAPTAIVVSILYFFGVFTCDI